ncbi:MAG TPA: T9SS type A sorting domain-containing protein, partial [Bacteroidia bacterium]|nr:T9SS type A sorting domain-containing protein [Bacteroidia bacterium]
HYNTTTKLTEIIATGTWSTTATATSWTQQSLKLTYDANLKTVAPDTIRFMASASSLFRPKINSTLYIDDIGFSGYVSTNNIDGVSNNVSVYPSPAKENVTISISVNAAAVEIFDLTGRSIGVFPMTNNKATIETANYSAGMYLYNVLGAQNNVLGRGKFEVVE